jgi:hypothetical protein
MPTLAGVLSDSGLHGLVVDRTGLKGAGDFSLKWSPDEALEQGGPNVISIFTAIQDQLGLKLKPAKLPSTPSSSTTSRCPRRTNPQGKELPIFPHSYAKDCTGLCGKLR